VAYNIIRLSEDCGVAIIVSPEDAIAWHKDNKYWLMNHNNKEFETFKEVNSDTVLGYFSGIADGLGWHPIPNIAFEEIKDAEKWVLEHKRKFYEDRYKKLYDTPEHRKEFEEFMKDLRREEK
jgi:hypothetical protein